MDSPGYDPVQLLVGNKMVAIWFVLRLVVGRLLAQSPLRLSSFYQLEM